MPVPDGLSRQSNGDEIGDGLLVLPGALEWAGDLGGPLAAMPGPGLLGALAEQLRTLGRTADGNRDGDAGRS